MSGIGPLGDTAVSAEKSFKPNVLDSMYPLTILKWLILKMITVKKII